MNQTTMKDKIIDLFKKHSSKWYEEYTNDTLVFVYILDDSWDQLAGEITTLVSEPVEDEPGTMLEQAMRDGREG